MKIICYILTLKKIWAKIRHLGMLISTRVCCFQHGYVDFNIGGYAENNMGYVDFNTHKDIYKDILNKRKPISYDIGKRKQTFLLKRSKFFRLRLSDFLDLESLQARRFCRMADFPSARTHEGKNGRNRVKREKAILRRFKRLLKRRIIT